MTMKKRGKIRRIPCPTPAGKTFAEWIVGKRRMSDSGRRRVELVYLCPFKFAGRATGRRTPYSGGRRGVLRDPADRRPGAVYIRRSSLFIRVAVAGRRGAGRKETGTGLRGGKLSRSPRGLRRVWDRILLPSGRIPGIFGPGIRLVPVPGLPLSIRLETPDVPNRAGRPSLGVRSGKYAWKKRRAGNRPRRMRPNGAPGWNRAGSPRLGEKGRNEGGEADRSSMIFVSPLIGSSGGRARRWQALSTVRTGPGSEGPSSTLGREKAPLRQIRRRRPGVPRRSGRRPAGENASVNGVCGAGLLPAHDLPGRLERRQGARATPLSKIHIVRERSRISGPVGREKLKRRGDAAAQEKSRARTFPRRGDPGSDSAEKYGDGGRRLIASIIHSASTLSHPDAAAAASVSHGNPVRRRTRCRCQGGALGSGRRPTGIFACVQGVCGTDLLPVHDLLGRSGSGREAHVTTSLKTRNNRERLRKFWSSSMSERVLSLRPDKSRHFSDTIPADFFVARRLHARRSMPPPRASKSARTRLSINAEIYPGAKLGSKARKMEIPALVPPIAAGSLALAGPRRDKGGKADVPVRRAGTDVARERERIVRLVYRHSAAPAAVESPAKTSAALQPADASRRGLDAARREMEKLGVSGTADRVFSFFERRISIERERRGRG